MVAASALGSMQVASALGWEVLSSHTKLPLTLLWDTSRIFTAFIKNFGSIPK
ncbi:unnamed protein product [Nezara viridula]|uniref:Uncharacterized protein n=1 Tax=Nezara viridula TaxID=85310 RepID=A0A9P0E3N4_NEZVI|nr:unnamed protein product [Nezara viridula]CAH1390290.1 unnamed protein product [Nezara viridula]